MIKSNKLSIQRETPFLIASIAAAVLFITLLPIYHPYPFSFLLKLAPLLSLSVLILLKTRGKERILILLALFFCMVGDVLLDLNRSTNFKPALGAFLVGHLFYILIFILRGVTFRKRIPFLVITGLYSLGIAILLTSIEKEFIIPVYAYLTIISLMTFFAFTTNSLSWLIAAGALIFMVSDTIIAINKFLQPIPYSTVFNIALYFTAQIMIIMGLVGKYKTGN